MTAFLLALALATKPCPARECEGRTCAMLADVVVEGRITQVVHHPNGEPLFKDFAEFTLVVDKVLKGKAPSKYRFRVGWCTNARALPEDTTGAYTFYLRVPDAGEVTYLDFEKK